MTAMIRGIRRVRKAGKAKEEWAAAVSLAIVILGVLLI